MIEIKSRFQFHVSSWFEALFALQVLTDDEARIHVSWKSKALERLPSTFQKKFVRIGGSPYIWPSIGDALLDLPVSLSFEERLERLGDLKAGQLQHSIFKGILHERRPVEDLLAGKIDLSHAITRVSKIKREWLAFLGLYPPRQNAPMFRALNLLLRAPQEFRTALLDLLQLFWQKVFHETWQSMESMLERSMEEKERLFQSCSLEEFARLALLRVEIDERKGILKAARGGYILSLKHLEKAVVLPSAFNDKRHWTCEDSNPQSVVAYFPYFDPAISPTRIRDAEGAETPEPDPALILKALGDTTRYAMVSLLAKEPLTSSDLAKTMSLTRATVSHHIHVLRDAGLIEDTVQGNSILLSLKRRVLEDLSALIIEKLFHTREILLKKTRTA